MKRIRHAFGLLAEIGAYSVVNRTWWPLPLIGLLLTLGTIVSLGQAAAPFIYTLF